MRPLHKIMIAAMVSLLPWQGMAADTPTAGGMKPTAASNGNKGGMPVHKMQDDYFNQIDTNGDGVLSHNEWIANAEKRFKEIDTNGDGKITREEMDAYRQKMRDRFRDMRANHPDMMKDSQGKKPEEK